MTPGGPPGYDPLPHRPRTGRPWRDAMKGTLGIVTALVVVNLLGIAVFSRAVAP